ncbi:chaplin [Streptomyces sp. NPDC002779]|uniref:chaplin n=1 Tax=Streptomyces sp. NPDC002779 TaxID=3364664 RepID=UPI00368B9520
MSRIAKAAAVAVGTGAMVVGGAGMALADADANATAAHSPGVLSGNVLQVPIHIPINLCGNTINVVGLLNPAFGNTCINNGGDDKKDGDRGHGHDRGHDNGKGQGGYGG